MANRETDPNSYNEELASGVKALLGRNVAFHHTARLTKFTTGSLNPTYGLYETRTQAENRRKELETKVSPADLPVVAELEPGEQYIAPDSSGNQVFKRHGENDGAIH